MTPDERLAAQRAKQAAAEAAVAKDLARQYGTAWARIRAQLDQLLAAMSAAKAAGETIDQGWLARHANEVAKLDAAAARAFDSYVDFAERRIDQAALEAALAGAIDANTLLQSTLPAGVSATRVALPTRATARLLRDMRPGRPLRSLLEELGPQASLAVREELVTGVALGRGPREIARTIRARSNMSLVRALRISRTEIVGAYRAAAIDRYRASRQTVNGWQWIASMSRRTCAMCVAMHGTIHDLDEPFESHPSCRCSPAPVTRPWAELGFPDIPETRLRVRSGVEWFSDQPVSTQRAILGPGKHAAYAQGQLTLQDLVQRTVSPVWGGGRRERSLRDALGVRA